MKTIANTLIIAAALVSGSAFAMTSSQTALDALRADTTSSSAQLRVNVQGSTAYLSGHAETAVEKRSAERALLRLAGITKVVNLVGVN